MRWVIEALLALSPLSGGFTASDLASRVRRLSKQSEAGYGPRRAAYDLKKLRGKGVVRRIGQTRRYESIPRGLRAMTAQVVLRNKAIKPLLASAPELRPSRGAQNPSVIDRHYDTIRAAMQGVFHQLRLAA
jgi:DNA-binding transcriptional ArsR family regulator